MGIFKIGIDLGGTKIEGVLLNGENVILERKRIPTLQEKGYDSIVSRIVGLVEELRAKIDGQPTIGIGTPGTISPATGNIRNSNTLCLVGQPLQHDLEKALNHKVNIANDANCFAVAETLSGAAKGYSTVFGVIMGTGVGGGIVLNGKAHNGINYIAGEWGHSLLHPGGNSCYCGKKGCVETYISGTALQKRWEQLTGEKKIMKEILATLDMDSRDAARQWKEEFIANFGIALSNIINILDPDIIVLGGGVSNTQFLYNEGIEEVKKNIFSEYMNTRIVQHQLGDSAGVIGAALL